MLDDLRSGIKATDWEGWPLCAGYLGPLSRGRTSKGCLGDLDWNSLSDDSIEWKTVYLAMWLFWWSSQLSGAHGERSGNWMLCLLCRHMPGSQPVREDISGDPRWFRPVWATYVWKLIKEKSAEQPHQKALDQAPALPGYFLIGQLVLWVFAASVFSEQHCARVCLKLPKPWTYSSHWVYTLQPTPLFGLIGSLPTRCSRGDAHGRRRGTEKESAWSSGGLVSNRLLLRNVNHAGKTVKQNINIG